MAEKDRTVRILENGTEVEACVYDAITRSLGVATGVPPRTVQEVRKPLVAPAYADGNSVRVGDAIVDSNDHVGLVEKLTESEVTIRHPLLGSVPFALPYLKTMRLIRRAGG